MPLEQCVLALDLVSVARSSFNYHFLPPPPPLGKMLANPPQGLRHFAGGHPYPCIQMNWERQNVEYSSQCFTRGRISETFLRYHESCLKSVKCDRPSESSRET